MIRCSSCLQVKPDEAFWWKRAAAGERQEWCKACRRAYRLSNREHERAQDNVRNHRRRHSAALNAAQ